MSCISLQVRYRTPPSQFSLLHSPSHKGAILLCETYKRVIREFHPRRDEKSIVERSRNAFERNAIAVSLYNAGRPFSIGDDNGDDHDDGDDDGGVKNLDNHEDPFLAARLRSVLFIPRPCSPQSITSDFFFYEIQGTQTDSRIGDIC